MAKVNWSKVDVAGIERLLARTPDKVEEFLDWMAESMVTDITLSFNTSPPGEAYTRGGVTHVASQPGYPPNIDIGDLKSSITWEKTAPLERTISDGVEYGIMLEDGTADMEPRPFIQPAFDEAAKRFGEDAKRILNLEQA